MQGSGCGSTLAGVSDLQLGAVEQLPTGALQGANAIPLGVVRGARQDAVRTQSHAVRTPSLTRGSRRLREASKGCRAAPTRGAKQDTVC